MTEIDRRARSAARLAADNDVLPVGTIVIEDDTGRTKRHNGATKWNDLPYWHPFPELTLDVRDFGAKNPGTSQFDNTGAFQDALDEAARGRGGVISVPPGEWWVSGLTIDSFVTLQGSRLGTQITHLPGATDHLIQNKTITTEQITIRDLTLNGARTLQTNAVDAIHLDCTGGTNVLKRYRVKNVYIQNVKNVGLFVGAFTGSSGFEDLIVYFCDKYGVQVEGASTADSSIQNVDVGQSGEHGIFMNQCGSYRVVNAKSWFSGRVGGGALGNGFHIRGVQQSVFDACVSQENQGWGFLIFGTGAGTPSVGINAGRLHSDGDNAAGGVLGGIRLGDLRDSSIQGVVGKFAGAAGTPAVALSLGTGLVGNNIDVAWSDVSGVPVTSGLAAASNNIRLPRGLTVITYAADVTPNIWTTETAKITLTGPITINAPAANVAGQRLRFVFVQDATGGRVVTFNAVYKTDWTPDTAANLTNVIEFVCDGASWVQTSVAVSI